MPVTVTWQTLACKVSAQQLAEKLGLPLAPTEGCNTASPYLLHVTEEQLEIVSTQQTPFSRLSVEFVKGAQGYRRLKGGGKNQAIARAVGLKNQSLVTVLDATAGLGRDAFVLATLGCKVHCVERSPIIAALLQDGLNRAKLSLDLRDILLRMQVTVGDAKNILSTLREANTPDVVYLDPMFPSIPKSALTKIEMRIIRDIVGDDLDAEQLLSLALGKAKKRVVVKRPQKAPVGFKDLKPTFSIEGKSNRYDVYLTPVRGLL